MKKIISIALLLVLLFAFAGFAQNTQNSPKDSKAKAKAELERAHYMVRLFSLLFSRSDATPFTRYKMIYWRKECNRLMIKAGQYKMYK